MKKIGLLVLLAPLASLASLGPAGADESMTLKEKQQWADLQKIAAEKSTLLTDKCGTKITVEWDVASFKGQDLDKQPPGAMCRDAANALASMCSLSAVSKSTIQKEVSVVTCKRSDDGTKVSRAGTRVDIHEDPNKTSIVGKEKGSYSWKSALEEVL